MPAKIRSNNSQKLIFDISSVEWLADFILGFKGNVIIVSHDRYFINKTATRILDLTAKQLLNYIGNYDYYLEKKEAVEDAFRYGKLVLATTTYNAEIFPFMREFINHLTERNYSNRTVAFIENGSWAPAATRVMKAMLEKSKDITYTENNVSINSALNQASLAQLESLAEEL